MAMIEYEDIYSNLNPAEPPEKLNPYKICVLLMLREYVRLIEEKKYNNSNEQRIMASAFLKLIQRTNSSFETLIKIVKMQFPKEFHLLFCSALTSITKCFDRFLSFLNEPKKTIFEAVDRESKTIVERHSIFGHFVRRLWLTTDKSSYTELTIIWSQFKSYVSEFSSNFDEFIQIFKDVCIDLIDQPPTIFIAESNDDELDLNFNGSSKELKRIIHHQISNLQMNQAKPLSQTTLNKWVNEMRKKYPDCYDLLFLKYLIAERVGNFVGAEVALHEYFDWNAVGLGKDKPDGLQLGWSKSLRFGPLLLAQLNREFDHREAALSHLHESIVKAQESNDNECLQYALAEYCLLNENNQSDDSDLQNLYNVSIKGSRDLNLQNIFEKTQLCQILHDFQNGKNVSKAVEALQAEASDISCQIKEDLYPVVLSSIYLAHGLIEQSSLEAQKFLCLHQFDLNVRKGDQISQSQCIAMCNLAFCLIHKGNVAEAKEIIRRAKSIFTLNQNFDHLTLCEASICFSESLYRCEFEECRKFISRISAVSHEEAALSSILLNIVVGNTEKTSLELKTLLTSLQTKYFRCRVLLLLTDYYIGIEKNVGTALVYAEECKKLSLLCEYRQFYAMIQRRMALILLLMNDPKSALDILMHSEKLNEMFVNQIELGKFYLTKAKCLMLLSKSSSVDASDAEEKYKEIGELLLKSLNIFQRCECLYLEKELSYHLAIFTNEQKLIEERNKWSKHFKELETKVFGHFPMLIL